MKTNSKEYENKALLVNKLKSILDEDQVLAVLEIIFSICPYCWEKEVKEILGK